MPSYQQVRQQMLVDRTAASLTKVHNDQRQKELLCLSLQQQVANQQQVINHQENRIAALQEQIERYKSQGQLLRAQLADLQQEYQSLVGQLDQSEVERKFQDVISAKEDEIASQNQLIADLTEQANLLKKRVDALEAERKSSASRAEQFSACQTQVNTLSRSNATLQAQLSDAVDQLERLQREDGDYKKLLQRYNALKSGSDSEIGSLRAANAGLCAQVSEQSGKIKDMRQRVRALAQQQAFELLSVKQDARAARSDLLGLRGLAWVEDVCRRLAERVDARLAAPQRVEPSKEGGGPASDGAAPSGEPGRLSRLGVCRGAGYQAFEPRGRERDEPPERPQEVPDAPRAAACGACAGSGRAEAGAKGPPRAGGPDAGARKARAPAEVRDTSPGPALPATAGRDAPRQARDKMRASIAHSMQRARDIAHGIIRVHSLLVRQQNSLIDRLIEAKSTARARAEGCRAAASMVEACRESLQVNIMARAFSLQDKLWSASSQLQAQEDDRERPAPQDQLVRIYEIVVDKPIDIEQLLE